MAVGLRSANVPIPLLPNPGGTNLDGFVKSLIRSLRKHYWDSFFSTLNRENSGERPQTVRDFDASLIMNLSPRMLNAVREKTFYESINLDTPAISGNEGCASFEAAGRKLENLIFPAPWAQVFVGPGFLLCPVPKCCLIGHESTKMSFVASRGATYER